MTSDFIAPESLRWAEFPRAAGGFSLIGVPVQRCCCFEVKGLTDTHKTWVSGFHSTSRSKISSSRRPSSGDMTHNSRQ